MSSRADRSKDVDCRAGFGRARNLLLAAVLLWAHGAFALDQPSRNVQFANLSADSGLSSEFVNDVVQDRQGFMWFATQAGLNRYDGHAMRVYEHRAGDDRSLSHSFVRDLYVDREGALLVGTDRGVNRYDPTTDSFERSPFGGLAAGYRVRTITQDATGMYWIGTVGSGLIGVRADADLHVHHRHHPDQPESLPDDGVIAVHEDSTGALWVGTDGGGLAQLDRVIGRFQVRRHDPESPDSLSDDRVRSIYEDRQGRLWIGTADGGLNRLDPGASGFRHFRHDPDDPRSLAGGQVRAVFEDAGETVWVGTDSGLSEWRNAEGGFVTYRRNAADRMSLINDRVNAVVQDDSGVLWIATFGGVSAWNYISDTFRYHGSAEGYVAADVITSFAETRDGRLWTGTYGGGLSRLDPQTGDVVIFRHDPDDPTSLSDDRVMTLHVDRSDTVWVGTRAGGLCRLDTHGAFQCFRHDPNDSTSVGSDAITRILDAGDGTLWIGTFGGGLSRLVRSGAAPTFRRYRHDPDDPTSISADRVLAIYQGAAGVLWVGTENAGLNRFDPALERFTHFDIDDFVEADGSNPVNGTPWELHEASDGDLWIGTLGQGLMRWSRADRYDGVFRVERFGRAEGLASDVYGILGGGDGELWLSSNRGLFRFDPQSGSVRGFDRRNGLRSNEFNHGARLMARDGRLLFGSTAGFVAFAPGSLRHNTLPPRIDLVASSRTEALARSTAGDVPRVELGHSDPFVSFDFVALDFVSPDKNAYRYRMRGYDNEWTEVDDYRRAIYSSLPAGSYTFEVQAANSDGVWNLAGPAIQVRVAPPPWRSPWAFLVYALVASGMAYRVVRASGRKRRAAIEQRRKLERLVEERTVELKHRNEELTFLNKRLEEASLTDQLTGLRNRRFVDQFIETEVSTVRRRHVEAERPLPDGTPRDSSKLMYVMMIDLDGFKPINDTWGHHAGDRALLAVKERLVACCRSSDVVVRWGGDEFLIVGRTASFAGAKALADKIRRTVADPGYDVGGAEARLSASIGVAGIPFVEGRPECGTWEQIVAIADHGAYLAKSNGRDAWVSLRGTEEFLEADLNGMKGSIAQLVAEERLVVDSSIAGPLQLEATAAGHRGAALSPSGAA